MDITVQAFELETGKGITMEMLYEHVQTSSGMPVDGRFLYVDRFNGWWRGLLLTARNIKAFTRLERNGGRIRLNPEAITNGELAHFNFFLLHEQRQRGLYQYYHGAASIHGFGNVLKSLYSDLKDQIIVQACKDAGEDPKDPPLKIKQRYAGFLKYQLVLRRQSFEEFIQSLRGVSKVNIQFKEYVPNLKPFRPLADKAKTIRHNLTFRDKYDGSLRDEIIELAHSDLLKDLRGVGLVDGNVERRFRLLSEPESLGNFDFNDVVLETEFDSNDVHFSLQKAAILERLKQIAEDDNWMMGRL